MVISFLMLLLISLPTFGPSEKVWPSLTKFGWWWLFPEERMSTAVVAPSVKPAGPGPKPDSSHLRPLLPTTLLAFVKKFSSTFSFASKDPVWRNKSERGQKMVGIFL